MYDPFETLNDIQSFEAFLLLKELYLQLMEQWITNHAEHCGVSIPPWPHEGECPWEMPRVLSDLHKLKLETLWREAWKDRETWKER